jgi:hypothetical protein
MTAADFDKIALSLEGAEEIEHAGLPACTNPLAFWWGSVHAAGRLQTCQARRASPALTPVL